MTRVWRASVVALLLALAAIGPASTQEGLAGGASVIDGDSIEIHGQRIRLFGIDAPESSQLCVRPTGQQASFALADLIGRSTVSCQPRDRDRYGRIVAVCFKGISDLNRFANGCAVGYHRYSEYDVVDEDAARRSRANIWSADFDMPWNWRSQRRSR
jgi:endonuclease YncB( thermonuclease family)